MVDEPLPIADGGAPPVQPGETYVPPFKKKEKINKAVRW